MNSETSVLELDLTEAEGALAAAVLEIVRYAQNTHEDSAHFPTERFALFSTDSILNNKPELAGLLPHETIQQARGDRHHLTSIEMAVHHSDVSKELQEAAWPEDIAGGYIHASLMGAMNNSPTDGPSSPIFAAAGALLTGETFTVVSLQDSSALRVGRDLIPELVSTLQHSLGL